LSEARAGACQFTTVPGRPLVRPDLPLFLLALNMQFGLTLKLHPEPETVAPQVNALWELSACRCAWIFPGWPAMKKQRPTRRRIPDADKLYPPSPREKAVRAKLAASALASDDELTPEMRAAMGQAILSARRYLISNFPREGEWLLTTAIARGFTDMLRNTASAAQAALVAAANEKLEGTRWRIVERVQ
jgi:hypothetical protein